MYQKITLDLQYKQEKPWNSEFLHEASGIQALRLHFVKLKGTHGRETKLSLLNSRAAETLQGVSGDGWEHYWPVCEAQLAAAHRFWSQTEMLIVDVAQIDIDVEDSLLDKCQALLDVCD